MEAMLEFFVMKVLCDKCGYELNIDDNLLLEGTIDFSCPNCQNGIKVDRKGQKITGDQKEDSDVHKTEILSRKLVPGMDEDETVIKHDEHEITIDKIAKELSKPGLGDPSRDISANSQTPETLKGGQSGISDVSSARTEIDSKTDPNMTINKPPLDKPIFSQSYSPSYERTEKSNKSILLKEKGFTSKFSIISLAIKSNLIIYIPLIIIGVISILYPILTLKNSVDKYPSDPSDMAVSEILTKASDYYSFDSAETLMYQGKLLLEALNKYPQNVKLKAALAKLYANLGSATFNPEMLNKSLELSAEILSQSPFEPDALRALAIYYIDDPETSAKYLNRAEEAILKEGGAGSAYEDYYLRSLIFINTGNYDKAIEVTNKAIAKNPDFIRGYRNLEQLEILKNDRIKVSEIHPKIVSLEDNFFSNHPDLKTKPTQVAAAPSPAHGIIVAMPNKKPRLKTSKGAETQKIELYDKKFQKAQDLFYKSKYLDAEQELLGAADAYKKSSNPKSRSKTLSSIYSLLGDTYLKLYKTDLALNAFKDSLKNNFANSEAHKGLGIVYEDIEEYKQAASEYRNYLKFNPSAWDAASISEKIATLDRKK